MKMSIYVVFSFFAMDFASAKMEARIEWVAPLGALFLPAGLPAKFCSWPIQMDRNG
jgi:hypothetical protein